MAAVFLAGVGSAAFGGELAARMLPALASIIPVEANLRETGADVLDGLIGEGDPNPLADNLGEFVNLGVPPAKVREHLGGREGAAFLPLLRVHIREYAGGLFRCRCCRGLLCCAVFAPLLIRTEAEP